MGFFDDWGTTGDGDWGGDPYVPDIPGVGYQPGSDFVDNTYLDLTDISDEDILAYLTGSGNGAQGPDIPGVGYRPGDDFYNGPDEDPTRYGGGGDIGGGGGGAAGGGSTFPAWMSGLFGNLTGSQLGALGLAIPALGSIFGKEGSPGSQTVTQELPPWYTDAAKGAIGDALYLPDYESFMQVPGALLSEADLAPYMNNYIDATLNPQLVRMGEDFYREGNQLDASAVKTGAFGGSRNVLEHSLAQERQNKRVDEATNNAYSQAFNSAMGLAGQDRGVIYQDFMNQFSNPYMQQDALNKTLGSVRPNTSSTTTGTAPESNPWDKILGIGSTLWGAMNPNGMQS